MYLISMFFIFIFFHSLTSNLQHEEMATFLRLPVELRNMIYSYLLILKDPIDPMSERIPHQKSKVHAQIISTNTQIYHEARAVLYSQNCFVFIIWSIVWTDAFFDEIGSENASYIRSVLVDFRDVCRFGRKVALKQPSALSLDRIQRNCTRLKTIVVEAFVLNLVPLWKDPQVTIMALSIMDARFRAFPTLREIIVEVYDYNPVSVDIRRQIESLGWRFNVRPVMFDGYGGILGS
jgi:hypothetical protein